MAFVLRAEELQIRVIEGDGGTYAAGSRATKGVTVQISDETGRPVAGASVGFRLPDNGPSGTFASGARMEIATTGPDGRATAWGMQWNSAIGPLELHVNAAKGQMRAGAVVSLYLTQPVKELGDKGVSRSHKKLWIALAAVGAAAAGVSIAAASKGAAASAASATAGASTLAIGSPTISIKSP